MIKLIQAAHKSAHFPSDSGFEIAFLGRSNSGKSSVLNRLCARKALSRVSRTQGRTREVLFFELEENLRLVDLPGYGYARVGADKMDDMRALIERYLAHRNSVRCLIQVVDIRHMENAKDAYMTDLILRQGFSLLILLNKADKLNRSKIEESKRRIDALYGKNPEFSVLVFSALKATGLEALNGYLNARLNGPFFGPGGSLERSGLISRRG